MDAIDTTGQATPVDVRILDGFADETPNGATGAWIGAKGLGCSLYDERAQRDGFFVGRGAGYDDERALLEVSDLDSRRGWTFTFYGSRSSSSAKRVHAWPFVGDISVARRAAARAPSRSERDCR